VPDRLGNRRLDTLTNLLDDPNMGMSFLVPGKRETLRISGTAQIVHDRWLREELAHQGRMPDLAIIVTVKRLYFHCAKCMIRSGLWQPGGWPATDHLPSLAETMVVHARLSESIAEAQARIDRDAVERLY
jgi:predicted pyridoxine 5'-phosphate oxidase superfamily flavin-nucleotide-binding protein